MTKLFVIPGLMFLAVTAHAAPAPTMQVAFKVDGGKDQRHYAVELVDKACGEVSAKTAVIHDEIRVCAHVEGANVRLEIDWQLHEKDRDIQNKSEMVLARGVTQELDGGTAKLAIALQ